MVTQLRMRDRLIFKAINDCQTLNISQIQMMFFSSYSSACRRIAQLVKAQYIRERYLSQIGTAPAASLRFFTLTKYARAVIRDTFGYLPDQIYKGGKQLSSSEKINHLFAINDIYAPFYRAIVDTPGWELLQWHNERYFRSQPHIAELVTEKGQEHKPLYPDGFIHVLINDPEAPNVRFFIEADNMTEDEWQIRKQVEVYEAYYNSGAYEATFNSKALRVLWVTKRKGHLQRLKKWVHRAGGERLSLFSTFEMMRPELIGQQPIWFTTRGEIARPLLTV